MLSTVDLDSTLDGELLERASQAAERWAARDRVRSARLDAIAAKQLLKADSPARLAARVNNLLEDVRRSTRNRRPPSNQTLKRLVERPLPVTAEELNSEIVEEVVLGARDFLSVEFLERGLVAARSVGRVLVRGGDGFRARGTGFMVAPGLLMTNQHVLTSLDLAELCAVEMDYEQNRLRAPKEPQLFLFEPKRFFITDKSLDYALVAVNGRSDRGADLTAYGWLPLNGAQGKIAITGNDYVNIVQHPLGREKEIVIRNNRVLDMRTGNDEGDDDLGPFLHYESDTEKGSSGSPVLNDQWEIVALHHSGVPDRNEAGEWLNKEGGIWHKEDQPVSDIRWVANEAIRVSSLVANIAVAAVPPEQRHILEPLLAAVPATAPSTSAESRRRGEGATDVAATERLAKRSAARQTSTRPAAASFGRPSSVAVMQVPLTITVSLGSNASGSGPAVDAAFTADEEALERLDPEDYVDRDGYNRNFLGRPVPFPRMKQNPRFGGALKVARPARSSDRFELRYHNYSVLMCAGRRLAYVSACNVDFAPGATASREEGSGSWRSDPRIGPQEQLTARFYDHNDYDKGHLTRRDDAAWGDTEAEAVAANNDTFHYTNAAPQHFLFNRSDKFTGAGLDLWGDLENHITAQGEAQRTRLTIFSGPIFGEADKRLKDALVPLRYFKIVVWRDEAAEPGAIGFVLDQAKLVASLAEEAIEAGEFEVRQHRIADIEGELDLDLGRVSDWDVLNRLDAEESIDVGGLPIRSLADIRL